MGVGIAAGDQRRAAAHAVVEADHAVHQPCIHQAAGADAGLRYLLPVRSPGIARAALPHRHTLLMNPEDLVAGGLVAHQRVPVLLRGL